jgi:hypothetical protein
MPAFSSSFTGSFLFGRAGGPSEYLEIIVDSVLLVSCQDIITIRATILGDTKNHSYYWEQIEGSQVEWLEDRNQAIVTYRKVPNFAGETVFRFWVDKNTPFQQFRDLVVTGNARDSIGISARTETPSSLNYNYLAAFNLAILPAISVAGTSTVNNQSSILQFELPNVLLPQTRGNLFIAKLENGNLITERQIAGNVFFGPMAANKSYSVISSYKTGASEILVASQPAANVKNSSVVTVDTTEELNTTVDELFKSEMVLFQRTSIELQPLDVPPEVAVIGVTQQYTSGLSPFQKIGAELVFIDQLEDQVTINNSSVGFGSKLSIHQVQTSTGITILG